MKLKPMVLMIVLLLGTASAADVINGGKGLPHTRAAWIMESGKLTVLAHTRFWGKVYQFHKPEDAMPGAETFWDVQSLFDINLGLGGRFECNITPIIYQDDQTKVGLVPYDTFIGLKVGSLGFKGSSFSYGAHFQIRFPTGKKHNLLFEEYSAGATEFGLTALASYAVDPLYPEEVFNLHANLGYYNHNDVGASVNERDKVNGYVLHQSQQIVYALGFTIPSENFNYGLEIYGNAWLQKPPLAAYSRENYLYVNGMVTYKPYRWFNFIVSGEVQLYSTKDETRPSLNNNSYSTDLPNYSSWRINIGSQVTLLPISVFRTHERDILIQRVDNRRELFELIIKERSETESAEDELERIREERHKAEQELERLRKMLEGQGTPKQELQEIQKQVNPKQ